jgi:hypothetical protein
MLSGAGAGTWDQGQRFQVLGGSGLAGRNESDDWAVQAVQRCRRCSVAFSPGRKSPKKGNPLAKCRYISGCSAQPTCVSSSFRFKIAVFVFDVDFDVED